MSGSAQEPTAPPTPPTSAPPKEGEPRLNRELVSRLSDQERLSRDLELIQQADRYFGGLSDQERALLGVDAKSGEPGELAGKTVNIKEAAVVEIHESETAGETKVLEEFPPIRALSERTASAAEWLWAGLAVAVFGVMAAWVLAVR